MSSKTNPFKSGLRRQTAAAEGGSCLPPTSVAATGVVDDIQRHRKYAASVSVDRLIQLLPQRWCSFSRSCCWFCHCWSSQQETEDVDSHGASAASIHVHWWLQSRDRTGSNGLPFSPYTDWRTEDVTVGLLEASCWLSTLSAFFVTVRAGTTYRHLFPPKICFFLVFWCARTVNSPHYSCSVV